MNRRMKRMSQRDGPAEVFLVDVVGRDRQLAGVVEQVVQQDLRGQHRQERQEQRGSCRGEHVAEVARRAHQHVLDGVGEDPPALNDPVGQHVQILLQQDHVGGVLGHIGGRVHRNADVPCMQGERVVDAVAEKGDVTTGAPLDADDAGLVLGTDPGEHGRGRDRASEGVVIERVDAGAGERRAIGKTHVAANLLGHDGVVPGDDLDCDAKLGKAAQRLQRRTSWST
jgi:hypothetical protein